MINAEKSVIKEWDAVLSEAARGQRYQALFKRLHGLVLVPSRKRRPVNLYKLNSTTKEGDNVVVPGKVLSTGRLDHKINLTALEYSEGALRSLKESGCRVSGIREMVKESRIKLIV